MTILGLNGDSTDKLASAQSERSTSREALPNDDTWMRHTSNPTQMAQFLSSHPPGEHIQSQASGQNGT